MTGHGAAVVQREDVTVSFEVRSVNGRHFKLSLRSGEGRLAWSSQIESRIREVIRRGTVFAQLQVRRAPSEDDFRIEPAALRSYYRQVVDAAGELGISQPVPLDALLGLPGVVSEASTAEADDDRVWPVVDECVAEALEQLQRMRRDEGAAMSSDLCHNLDDIDGLAERVRGWAPEVVAQYRDRLHQRLANMLGEHAAVGGEAEIAREVALFADRCDISEELVRLESHCRQFRKLLEADESQGRKLEFLLQEMNREANTTAAKANDSRISQAAVDIKAAFERMREMVQNIE